MKYAMKVLAGLLISGATLVVVDATAHASPCVGDAASSYGSTTDGGNSSSVLLYSKHDGLKADLAELRSRVC